MKLLHVNCNYVGTTLHQKMIEKLSDQGVESKVFVPVYDKNVAVIQVNDNVTVAECFEKWDRICFSYKQNKIFKAVQDCYSINEFHLIHAYTLFTDGNIAMNLKKKYGIPYVVAIRNTDVNSFFKYMVNLRKLGIKIMREASAVFFLSETYKNQVFSQFVPNKYRKELLEKTFIIPNGIDDFWINNRYKSNIVQHSQRFSNKNLKVVYAGRIDKNKNIPTALKALELLKQDGWKTEFTVVGKIIDHDEFNEIVKNNMVSYLEAQPKEKLLEIYRGNDIFVMPSYTESFGLVYAEAMSQGLPVIYTAGQGFDGQFQEGVVGKKVNSKSFQSVKDGISAVINDYEQISGNLYNCVEKFRWDSIVGKYAEIYSKIVEGIDSVTSMK